MREIGHFVGGKAVKGCSGRFGDVFNPATGEVQARVDEPGADPVAPRGGVDQQDPELGRGPVGFARVLGGHAQHAPRPPAVKLRDPAALARPVGMGREVGDDPRNERLES